VNQGLRIIGSAGIAEVDSQDRGSFIATTASPAGALLNPFSALEYDHPMFGAVTDGYVFESMRHFIDVVDAHLQGCAVAGRYPDGASALASIRLAQSVKRSLASGAIVTV